MVGPVPSCEVGMVHGRFQPFHVGHLDYLLTAAKMTSSVLFVGITNPSGAGPADASDDHRHSSVSNPFTFLERFRMVRSSVPALRPDLVIVPFDVQSPETWGFIPQETVQFVSAFEGWDEVKIRLFLEAGFRVERLGLERLTSATEVRARLAEGLDVSELVPDGTLQVIRAHSSR